MKGGRRDSIEGVLGKRKVRRQQHNKATAAMATTRTTRRRRCLCAWGWGRWAWEWTTQWSSLLGECCAAPAPGEARLAKRKAAKPRPTSRLRPGQAPSPVCICAVQVCVYVVCVVCVCCGVAKEGRCLLVASSLPPPPPPEGPSPPQPAREDGHIG